MSEEDGVGASAAALRAPVQKCRPQDCPQLEPRCPDGEPITGPAPRCVRQPDGVCNWDRKFCSKPSVCGFVSVGAAGAETELHAANFATAAEANAWAKQFGSGARLEILSGTCASQSDICTLIYDPVCAYLNLSAERTFGNRCELRVATLDAAGDALRADAYLSHAGECTIACASSAECDDGAYCTTEDGVCNRPPGCGPDDVCITLCYGECASKPANACEGKACGESCEPSDGSSGPGFCSPDGECRTRSEAPRCDFVDCDVTHALCRRLPPACPAGQTASIQGICFGGCVPIEECGCSPDVPSNCPEDYVCWRFAGHCGPYVN